MSFFCHGLFFRLSAVLVGKPRRRFEIAGGGKWWNYAAMVALSHRRHARTGQGHNIREACFAADGAACHAEHKKMLAPAPEALKSGKVTLLLLLELWLNDAAEKMRSRATG